MSEDIMREVLMTNEYSKESLVNVVENFISFPLTVELSSPRAPSALHQHVRDISKQSTYLSIMSASAFIGCGQFKPVWSSSMHMAN